jgi:hypothetical protein
VKTTRPVQKIVKLLQLVLKLAVMMAGRAMAGVTALITMKDVVMIMVTVVLVIVLRM